MGIPEVTLAVAPVRQMRDGRELGSGSGFFYRKGDDLYLVTGRLLMKDDRRGRVPDTLRIQLHNDRKDAKKVGWHEEALYRKGSPVWRLPPDHPQSDVALLKLNYSLMKEKYFFKPWSKADFLPPDYAIAPGEDVLVLGYPKGFTDDYNNLPLFQSATLASPYGAPFRRQRLSVIDALGQADGVGGGPVVTKPKAVWLDGNGKPHEMDRSAYHLLGVYSTSIDPDTPSEEKGKGAAWHPDLVEGAAY